MDKLRKKGAPHRADVGLSFVYNLFIFYTYTVNI